METFPHRHILGIEGLSRADIEHVLDTSNAFLEVSRRPVRKVPTLRGKTVINLFYENSTRTRTSFEIAEKRLSADTLNFSASTSRYSSGAWPRYGRPGMAGPKDTAPSKRRA